MLPKKRAGMTVSVHDALKTVSIYSVLSLTLKGYTQLLQDSTSVVYTKHKAFLHTIETLMGNYGTILMTKQDTLKSNGVTKDQHRKELNMEFITACIQEHFQEVSRSSFSQ